jgi:hypothetical protein
VVLKHHHAPDPRLAEQPAPSVVEAFPVGKQVVYCGSGPNFGGLGKVSGHVTDPASSEVRLLVDLEVPSSHPTFGNQIALRSADKTFHFSEVSRRLNISPKVLSKVQRPYNYLLCFVKCLHSTQITASVYIQWQNKKLNVGLRIKFTRKNKQVIGYTERIETPSNHPGAPNRTFWVLTSKALDLVREYTEKFPDLFDALEQDDAQDVEVYTPEMLFPNGDHEKRLSEIDQWLKSRESNGLPRVPVGSKALPDEAVKAIERESDQWVAREAEKQPKIVKVECASGVLLSPLSDVPVPDDENEVVVTPSAQLGDRVMNLLDNGPIPFSWTGTVTAIVGGFLEIVFDKPFMGGSNMNRRFVLERIR